MDYELLQEFLNFLSSKAERIQLELHDDRKYYNDEADYYDTGWAQKNHQRNREMQYLATTLDSIQAKECELDKLEKNIEAIKSLLIVQD